MSRYRRDGDRGDAGTQGVSVEGGRPTPATSEGVARLALLDLMRTVALLRVVAYHVTGLDPLTWLASMPVMFFVAGSLFARSLRRRRGLLVVRDRFRRILPSLFAYATVLVVLYASLGLLTGSLGSVRDAAGWITELGRYDTARLFVPVISLEPPVGPGDPDQAVFWTWNALWYVHTHLLLAAVGPLLIMAYKRWFTPMWIVLGVLWVLDAVANQGAANTNTFLLFFVAGFSFDDGRLLQVPARRLKQVTVGAAVGGLALVPLGADLAINTWAPSLLLIGMAWVTGCLAWRGPLEQLAMGRLFAPLIAFVNRRALTIYLWSLLGVYVSRLLWPPVGGWLDLAWIAVASIALTAVVTVAACIVVGWIEDLAARRPVEWWPRRAPAPAAVRGAQPGSGADPTT